jgi:hypothetical protein
VCLTILNRQALKQYFGATEMKLATLGAILSAITICIGCQDAELRPAYYPSGVPSYAVWSGGADGGAYISCTANLPRNTNYCRVWNDNTGQLGGAGDYQLENEHRGATQDELKYRGAGGNGEIYLENNLTLKVLPTSRE